MMIERIITNTKPTDNAPVWSSNADANKKIKHTLQNENKNPIAIYLLIKHLLVNYTKKGIIKV